MPRHLFGWAQAPTTISHQELVQRLNTTNRNLWNDFENRVVLRDDAGSVGGVFNVKDPRFGAAGDGVRDDTVAIQAAIDAAYAVGGGTVYVPPGNYLISASLTVKYRVNIVGSGDKNANLSRLSAATGMFSPVIVNDLVNGIVIGTGEDGNSQRINSSSLRHLAIINRQVSADADAIRLTNCWTFDVQDCYVQSYYAFSFRLLDCNALSILNCFHNAGFAHSLADSVIWGNQSGPTNQPAVDTGYVTPIWWFNGAGAWKNLVASNFIFNANNGRTVTFTATGTVTNITATAHGYTNGTPVMLETTGTLPGSLTGLNVPAWVTVVDANTIKLSSTRPNYLTGVYLTPADAGVGTHNFRIGGKANLFLTGALKNSFVNNRFDQSYWHGVELRAADRNVLTGNTIHENGRANATGCAGVNLVDSDANAMTGNAIDGAVVVTATGTSNQVNGIVGDATSAQNTSVGNTVTNHSTANYTDGHSSMVIVDVSRTTLPASEDVSLSGVTGTLVVGGTGAGQHIAMDGNEIMSKSDPTTAGILNLQANGGIVSLGGALTTEASSARFSLNTGTASGANTQNCAVEYQIGATAQWMAGTLGATVGATTDYILWDDLNNVVKLRVVQGATGLMSVTGPLSASTRMTAPLFGTTTAVDVVFDRNSVTQLTLGSLLATFAGDVNVASGKVYKVNGTQVVSAQGVAVTATPAAPTGGLVIDAEARTAIAGYKTTVDDIIARMQAHGLVA